MSKTPDQEQFLDRVLTLAPHLRLARASESVMFVVGERERFALSRGSAAPITALLDGQRSVRDVVLALAGEVSEAQVLHSLAQLVERGLLVAAGGARDAERVFWSSLGVSRNIGESASLVVAGCDGMALYPRVAELLTSAGLTLVDDAPLLILVAEDYLHPDVERLARAARARGQRCYLAKPCGTVGWFGPLLLPNQGPCWRCLQHAVRSQRPVEARLEAAQSCPPAPVGAARASLSALLGSAALDVARRLSDGSALTHELRTLDLATFEGGTHYVRRRPQCPECGDDTLQAKLGDSRVELAGVRCLHTEDGGYRTEAPEQMYDRLRHLVSAVLGPVTHLEPCRERGARRWPVFRSGYLAAPQQVAGNNVFDRVCAGKGQSVAQARASALAEAIERYVGVYQGDEPVTRASFRELGSLAIHPDALQLFSDSQLTRGEIGSTGPGARIPRRFELDAVVDWVPVWSLTSHCRRYVPLSLCYTDTPQPCGSDYFAPSSNGSAAGSTIEEAILQGLLELIERDAVAIWWYNRVALPAFSSGADAHFGLLSQRERAQGWSAWTLDCTHDLAVPVACTVCHDSESGRLAIGFGCHVRSDLAVQRSVAELNQVLDRDARRSSPWDALSGTRPSYLWPRGTTSTSLRADVPARAPDLKTEIESLVARLAQAGLEVLVIDKTRPDIDLRVVQVLVPGLRHIWPRLAPGRLYDVPVRMGWRAAALAESELNPVPLLL